MAPFLLRGRLRASARGGQRNRSKILNSKMKKLREEMEEITADQRQVREKFEEIKVECEQLREETELMIKQNVRSQIASAQRQVKDKFEAIEAECEQLRKETELIKKQSVRSQIASALMSHILKAREAEDFNIVASLKQIFVLAFLFCLSVYILQDI